MLAVYSAAEVTIAPPPLLSVKLPPTVPPVNVAPVIGGTTGVVAITVNDCGAAVGFAMLKLDETTGSTSAVIDHSKSQPFWLTSYAQE